MLFRRLAQIAATAVWAPTLNIMPSIWTLRGEAITSHRNLRSRRIGSIGRKERLRPSPSHSGQPSPSADGEHETSHDASQVATLSSDACLFCMRDEASLNTVIDSNETFYARLDNFPATPGHVEVVPKRHVESFFDLSESEVLDAYALIRIIEKEIAAQYGPGGYTIGVNEGRVAGRSVDHLHIHLIPRHEGDVPDPRGGIRQVVPNCDPDAWVTTSVS